MVDPNLSQKNPHVNSTCGAPTGEIKKRRGLLQAIDCVHHSLEFGAIQ